MSKVRKWVKVMRLCSAASLAVLLLAATGCESEKDKDYAGVDAYFEENPYEGGDREDPRPKDLEITPDLAAIGIVGRSVVFQGRGGTGPYRWSVSNPDKGRIESLGWSEAVYTSLQVGNNDVVVQDRDGHFAAAKITPVDDFVSISPYSISLSGGTRQAAFSATGGSPPYRWSVGNAALGTVSYSADSSHLAGYTAVSGAYGVNVVTVEDSEGRTDYATVTQSE